MAPPTLYDNPVSPPCRLVRLVAGIIGVDLKIVNGTDMKSPEMLKKVPQHTVPALEDNGLYLAESRAIAMYLISKYVKDDSLYPKDVNKRVLVDQRLFFDQDLYNRILSVFLPKFFGKPVDPSNVDKVNDGLETLNRMLDGKQWLAGDKITLADYAVANSLSALEFAPESGIDPTKQPNIKQWLPRVESSHPKYRESLNEFREGLKKMAQK
ncbi:glutathione S-transferase 1-like [Schistocerca serialis cubense]|uniref:glutathione S-transferase 1-like n=1 Tax=Schistocerca serialis cubense TaxID=2023355 RepID=UPI00214E9F7C|nr:glutathione S-transferase 1-like [Schistocerca serialis cubense]